MVYCIAQYTDYTKEFFTFKVSKQFHDTYLRGNFIYAHKKSMAFCLLICMSHKHTEALCA